MVLPNPNSIFPSPPSRHNMGRAAHHSQGSAISFHSSSSLPAMPFLLLPAKLSSGINRGGNVRNTKGLSLATSSTIHETGMIKAKGRLSASQQKVAIKSSHRGQAPSYPGAGWQPAPPLVTWWNHCLSANASNKHLNTPRSPNHTERRWAGWTAGHPQWSLMMQFISNRYDIAATSITVWLEKCKTQQEQALLPP